MKGFGLIETIVALGLFSVVMSAGILGFIPALQSGRSAREQTQAISLAREGLEAARSIRDRSFANITSGTFGIGISSSLWAFAGTSDVNDKFRRQLLITQVSRDTGGSMVVSGGTTDPDTFNVSSDIYWNNAIGDTRFLSIDTVLTNWRKLTGGVSYDGLIIYGDGTTLPKWRNYTSSSNILSSKSALPSVVGSPRNFVIRTSPTKTEAIAGALSTDGKLYIYCFDGNIWTQDWSVTIGVGTTRTRPFDIAYENTTGNVVVLYSTNVPTTNELNFRTKSGTNSCGVAQWGSATAFDPVRTSGIVSWVKMTSNPTTSSNLIATSWVDFNKDLSSAIWNGTTFTNEPSVVGETSLEAINTGISFPDVDAFDLAYESVSGDLLTVWGVSTGTNAINGVKYRLCTGNSSSCTWGTGATPPTFADDATNLDLSANPNSDEMVFASIGNAGSDLQIGYWSGVGWTNTANVDITAQIPVAGSHLVSTGWLTSGANTRSVIVYNDAATTNIGWYSGNRGVFTSQPDFTVAPVFANPQTWYETTTNPKSKDQLMFTIADNGADLFAKRLTMNAGTTFTWVASDGSTQIEATLGQTIVKPFGFAFWIK